MDILLLVVIANSGLFNVRTFPETTIATVTWRINETFICSVCSPPCMNITSHNRKVIDEVVKYHNLYEDTFSNLSSLFAKEIREVAKQIKPKIGSLYARNLLMSKTYQSKQAVEKFLGYVDRLSASINLNDTFNPYSSDFMTRFDEAFKLLGVHNTEDLLGSDKNKGKKAHSFSAASSA